MAESVSSSRTGWWGAWQGSLVRLALAVLPLVWLSQRVKLQEVLDHGRQVGFGTMALAYGCLWLSLSAGTLRWRALLRAYGVGEPPPLSTLFGHFLVGQYFNVLPTGLAGDAVRGLRVRDAAGDLPTSYTVLFIERLAGMLGLCLIAGTAMLTAPALRSSVVLRAFDLAALAALGLAAGAFAAPVVLARAPRLRALVAKVPVAGPLLLRVPAPKRLGPSWPVLPLSLLTQGGVIACMALLLRPLAPAATVALCARVIPPIILFTYLPLTPGGLGQREAVSVYLFGLAGIDAAAATTASLLLGAELFALALSGGVVLLYERAKVSRREPPAP